MNLDILHDLLTLRLDYVENIELKQGVWIYWYGVPGICWG